MLSICECGTLRSASEDLPQLKDVLLVIDDVYLNNKIFSFDETENKNESPKMPQIRLKQELFRLGYDYKTFDLGDIDSAEVIIFADLPVRDGPQARCLSECIRRGYGRKMLLWLWEGPAVKPHQWDKKNHVAFDKVLTWNDDLVDGVKYIKMHLPNYYWEETIKLPFSQKKLCTMIAHNKYSVYPLELYSERIRAIYAFERLCPYQFDLYGGGWNKPANIIQQMYPTLTPIFHSYRGQIVGKGEILKMYKFSICYENLIGVPGLSGYITEKLFDSFMSGCVPIYLGANNINEYVPSDTYIDRRRFASYDKMIAHLVNMSEQEHESYLINIKKHLKSELYQRTFAPRVFVDLMVSQIVKK